MERMVAILLEKETVGPDEVAEIFSDVPSGNTTPTASLRIRPPGRVALRADDPRWPLPRHPTRRRRRRRSQAPRVACQDEAGRRSRLLIARIPVARSDRIVAIEVDLPAIEEAVRQILVAIGEDPEREGLAETPDGWPGCMPRSSKASIATPATRWMPSSGKSTIRRS